MMDIPLPMQIYDFKSRYKTIEPEQVFEVWSSIHTHIDYANGMGSRKCWNMSLPMRPRVKYLLTNSPA